MSDHEQSLQESRWTEALDELFDPYDLADAPGGAVGVSIGGRVIYRRPFGLANVELRVHNTLSTRFRIASITKQFTCLAALILAEQGKLDIEKSIRAYVPELGMQSGEPTLRQLMNHSSGYRCYTDLGFIADGPAVHPASNALKLQLQQARGNFPPGERLIYCNGSYSLLSLAIERVSQKSFAAVLRELILSPAGLADTTLVPSDYEVHDRLANLYIKRDAKWRRWIFFTEGLSGDGGLISSVEDMLRWAQHLRGPHSVGSAWAWRQMLSPTVLANGYVSGYSLGLELDTYRGARLIRHSGGVVGGTSHLVTVPEHELDLFLVTNGSAAVVTDLGTQIIDTILGDRLAQTVKPAPVEQYRHLLGSYHCDRSGMLIGLEESKGSLALRLAGGPPILLLETAAGLAASFLQAFAGDWLIRQPSDHGGVCQQIVVEDCGHPDVYRRVATAPAAGPQEREPAGAFFSPELQAQAEFLAINGKTELHIQGPYGSSEWDINVLEADLAIAVNKVFPIWTAAINFRRHRNAIAGFELSSKRTRQLMFERKTGKTIT